MPNYSQSAFNGVDVVSPGHIVAEDEVAAATNIDFSLSRGGLACRRGSTSIVTVSGSSLIYLGRFFNDANNISNGPTYVNDAAGNVYRGTGAGGYSTIVTGGATALPVGFTSYRNYEYIASNSVNKKDDGAATTDWILKVPGNPAFGGFTVNTQTYLWGGTAISSMSSQGLEGVLVSSSPGVTLWTATFSSDANSNRAAITWSLVGTPPNGGLKTSNPAFTFESIDLAFDNPSLVTRISYDLSVNDTTFANYLHTELDPGTTFDPNTANVDNLIQQLVAIGTGTNSAPLNFDDKTALINQLNNNLQINQQSISNAHSSIAPFVGNRLMNFVMNGTSTSVAAGVPNDPWLAVMAGRLIIEANGVVTCTAANGKVLGGENNLGGGFVAPLNDVYQGYSYWRTYAALDTNSNVIAESAPTPIYGPFKIQYAQWVGTCTDTLSATNGLNATIIYRQGGLATVPYAVATISLSTSGTTTSTFTDTTYDLIQIQNNFPMTTQDTWPPSFWPGGGIVLSEPFHDRIFMGVGNVLNWTLPGQPYAVPKTSRVVVSSGGDSIRNIFNWQDRLVIVNRDSIYEVGGDTFEGPQFNMVVQRSGSKHGSIAPNATIKTPYGIFLMDYDGFYMYWPGQGIDQAIEWANQRLADIFRGNASFSPATEKGSRIQPINMSNIINSAAAYNDGKIYVAVPTASNSTASSVFVLDMATKKCWFYQYPFSIASLFWNKEGNQLLAGCTNGQIIQLEVSNGDLANPIAWSAKTRAFTAATDSLLETVSVEFQGGGTCTISANLDGTATLTAGTLTSTNKQWYNLSLNGTVANYIDFTINGTQSGTAQNVFSNINFDLFTQPKRLTYFRTEPDVYQETAWQAAQQRPMRTEQIWDVLYHDIELLNLTGTSSASATVTAVSFIDNVAIMTNLMIAPTGGRVVEVFSFPPETYGYVGYTTYTSTSTNFPFKLWASKNQGRPEPPRVTSYVSDRFVHKEEQWWHHQHGDLAIFPTGTATQGTVVATAYIDEVAVNTLTYTGVPPVVVGGTATGTGSRLVYVDAFPFETYGHVGQVRYVAGSNTVFKHYQTWYNTTEEPDRLVRYETPHKTVPSENYVKTWLAELNPLGGTVTGTLFVEDDVEQGVAFANGYVAVTTVTFTGTTRHIFENTVPNITTGKTVKAWYQSTTPFKHYGSDWELEPKPFGKTDWLVTYRKLGGATQLDMLRYWVYDIEAPVTATITSVWNIDGIPFSTNTIVVAGRRYTDYIPFPPGGRGYLFQQTLNGDKPFKVWKSSLDIERVGVKGFSRLSLAGTPTSQ